MKQKYKTDFLLFANLYSLALIVTRETKEAVLACAKECCYHCIWLIHAAANEVEAPNTPRFLISIFINTLWCTLIKKKRIFSSYIRKFRMEQLQSHI